MADPLRSAAPGAAAADQPAAAAGEARSAWARFAAVDPVDFALRATLLYLLIDELAGPWFVRCVVLVVAPAALLLGLQRSPRVWGAIVLALAAKVAHDWLRVDNHSWLTFYWCLALGLALAARDDRAIALNARWLVGLCMAAATLWKAWLAPDFLSGDFFHHTFLWDARFEELASLLGPVDPAVLAANRQAALAQIAANPPAPLALQGGPGLAAGARALAWLTVLVEGALALGFLWPAQGARMLWRDALLVGFCFGTYAIAPVAGFGALLAILGFAQIGREQVGLKLAYAAAFVVVYFHDWVPWRPPVAALLRGLLG